MTTVVNKKYARFDVYIGRGSIWGNPFKIEDSSREDCIAKYEVYMRNMLANNYYLRIELMNLKGKTLGCFCKPLPCHGDVLIKLINELS